MNEFGLADWLRWHVRTACLLPFDTDELNVTLLKTIWSIRSCAFSMCVVTVCYRYNAIILSGCNEIRYKRILIFLYANGYSKEKWNSFVYRICVPDGIHWSQNQLLFLFIHLWFYRLVAVTHLMKIPCVLPYSSVGLHIHFICILSHWARLILVVIAYVTTSKYSTNPVIKFLHGS